jgi:LuxR family maltose regulon positive regulatory protein
MSASRSGEDRRMQKTDSLLRTKFRPPFIRPMLVPRPRLQARIAEGLRCPLTVIVAPAGFGKTTVVAADISTWKTRVAWLSLDRDDNLAGRFLNYLVAALGEADNTIGNESAQLMSGMQQVAAEAVLTSLINDLDSAGREIVLVFDDYQFIYNQAVHEQVTFLLEHCPSTFHMVIATRSDPPLPLARLRALGQIMELRAADLRFTESEAAQFLNDVMGLHLDPRSVAALEERTEGWIAGLQMAALSMRDHRDSFGFIEGFSGTNRYILDYLLEEVLESQSQEIQHFLLHTSILERLTAPLCEVLLEVQTSETFPPSHLPACQQTLEYLERSNLFLVPLDEERIWYRYHHLFADLLRARLHQTRPELIPLLHTRASDWLEENGFITEAIHHLFAVQEMERAADLIERHGPIHLAESDPSVLQLADGLPAEVLLARPKIGLYQAWLLIIHGHIRKALPLLNDLARPLSSGAGPHPRWMQTIASLARAFLAPPESAPEFDPLLNDPRLDEIPAEELILRNAADILYGMALARRGELDRAAQVAAECIQREKTLHGLSVIPTLAPFLTRLYLMQGRLSASASLCHEFLEPIQAKSVRIIYTSGSGSMNIDRGEVLYERNCLERAEQHIRDGLRANEPWRNIMTDGFGLIALTRVLLAKGDYAAAMHTVERFEARLQEISRPREFEEKFHTLRVRVQLASGDLQNAADWADQIQRNEAFHLHPELYRLTLAQIRLAQGRYAEVQGLLAGMTPLYAADSRITRQLESNLLMAAVSARQSRLPEAFALIEASLALAEPEGYIRIFLDVGEPARELLAAYLRSEAPAHRPYAQKVLDAFSVAAPENPPNSQSSLLIEPLSARELEVLSLLALGKTNQEIARQLIVAAGTVKAHTASIYRKLDAANRTEAVARARHLGILP